MAVSSRRARRLAAPGQPEYEEIGAGAVELASGNAGGGIRLLVEMEPRPGGPSAAELARQLRYRLLPK